MTNPAHHIIGRIVLELETEQSSEAWELQEELSQILHQQAIPEMERLFDRWVGADEVVRLDELVIDLPPMNPYHLADELVPQLLTALDQALSDRISSQRLLSSSVQNSSSSLGRFNQTEIEADWEVFLYFLEYGRLPWWRQSESLSYWIGRWEVLLQQPLVERTALQRLLVNQLATRQRLVEQLPERLRQSLILRLQPAWTDWSALLGSARSLMEELSFNTATVQYLEKQAWLILFSEIQVSTTENAILPKRQWIQGWLREFRAVLETQQQSMNGEMYRLISRLSITEQALWLEELQAIAIDRTAATISEEKEAQSQAGSSQADALLTFLYFLEYGRLPWGQQTESLSQWIARWEALLQDQEPFVWRTALQQLLVNQPANQQRLVEQLPESFRQILISQMQPAWTDWSELLGSAKSLMQGVSFNAPTVQYLEKQAWLVLFSEIQASTTEDALLPKRQWIQGWLREFMAVVQMIPEQEQFWENPPVDQSFPISSTIAPNFPGFPSSQSSSEFIREYVYQLITGLVVADQIFWLEGLQAIGRSERKMTTQETIAEVTQELVDLTSATILERKEGRSQVGESQAHGLGTAMLPPSADQTWATDPDVMEEQPDRFSQTNSEAEWAVFLYFLEYGRLPRGQQTESLSYWIGRWEALLQEPFVGQAALQRLLVNQPETQQRLVEQFPESFRQTLILQLQPAWTEWPALLEDTRSLMQALWFNAATVEYLEKQAWLVLFAEIRTSTPADAVLPKRQWIRNWLREFIAVLERMPASEQWLGAVLDPSEIAPDFLVLPTSRSNPSSVYEYLYQLITGLGIAEQALWLEELQTIDQSQGEMTTQETVAEVSQQASDRTAATTSEENEEQSQAGSSQIEDLVTEISPHSASPTLVTDANIMEERTEEGLREEGQSESSRSQPVVERVSPQSERFSQPALVGDWEVFVSFLEYGRLPRWEEPESFGYWIARWEALLQGPFVRQVALQQLLINQPEVRQRLVEQLPEPLRQALIVRMQPAWSDWPVLLESARSLMRELPFDASTVQYLEKQAWLVLFSEIQASTAEDALLPKRQWIQGWLREFMAVVETIPELEQFWGNALLGGSFSASSTIAPESTVLSSSPMQQPMYGEVYQLISRLSIADQAFWLEELQAICQSIREQFTQKLSAMELPQSSGDLPLATVMDGTTEPSDSFLQAGDRSIPADSNSSVAQRAGESDEILAEPDRSGEEVNVLATEIDQRAPLVADLSQVGDSSRMQQSQQSGDQSSETTVDLQQSADAFTNSEDTERPLTPPNLEDLGTAVDGADTVSAEDYPADDRTISDTLAQPQATEVQSERDRPSIETPMDRSQLSGERLQISESDARAGQSENRAAESRPLVGEARSEVGWSDTEKDTPSEASQFSTDPQQMGATSSGESALGDRNNRTSRERAEPSLEATREEIEARSGMGQNQLDLRLSEMVQPPEVTVQTSGTDQREPERADGCGTEMDAIAPEGSEEEILPQFDSLLMEQTDSPLTTSDEREASSDATMEERDRTVPEALPRLGDSEQLLHPLMARPPRRETEPTLSQTEEANGIYLNGAGLVLLHPFLKFYFEAVGLIEEDGFCHEYAQQVAIALLHYLVTGQRQAPEYDLVLPKLLCGWPLNQPVSGDLELPEAALTEGNHLLETVIGYWEVLKNTSPDGLREGFLQRQGKLTKTESGGWKLRVEQQAIDILLTRLPWGISMVKLPWLEEVMIVEWA